MTLFEKIIARDIPAEIVFEDEHCLAFRDISPQAPTHLLLIPKRLIPRLGEAAASDAALLGHLLICAGTIAREQGFADGNEGFRLVINHGRNGGETVPHLHLHLLAGRPLCWPPG
jgi:histidine triad (HIT) family protein